MENTFTQIKEKVVDKWYFGDITIEDFQQFSEVFIEHFPNIESGSVLLATACDESAYEEDMHHAFKTCLASIDMPLEVRDRLAYIRNRSQKAFEEIVFSITDKELNYIAALDYQQDVEEHKRNLKKVIFEHHGLFTLYRYSYEVIELGRHYVQTGNEKAFAICNCIVAQNILWDIDHSNEIAWMLEKTSEYAKLPENLYKNVMCCLETAHRFQKLAELKPYLFSMYNLKYS